MKLSANPADFLVLQFDTDGGNISSVATSAALESGQGAQIPTIPAGEWIPALAVDCLDPDYVSISQLKTGDWIFITSVDSDTISFRRSTTARVIAEGEYLLFSFGAYEHAALLQKMKDIEYALSYLWGGGDGVPRLSDAAAELQVVPTSPATMTVTVNAGFGWIGNINARLSSNYTTPVIVKPESNSRIDLVELVLGVGGASSSITVKTGTAAVSPSAPSVDAGAIALAEILLTSSSTSITAGMITDRRTRV